MIGTLTKQCELFRDKLKDILDFNHPLYQAALLVPWSKFESTLGTVYVEKKGRPGFPIRLMVGLLLLKYMRNLSDRNVLREFTENNYFQYFCGYKHYDPAPPMDETTLVKFRHRLDDENREMFLEATFQMGLECGLICIKDVENLIVDTTAQEKNITYPSDAKIYHKLQSKLRELCYYFGVKMRRSYVRISAKRLRDANLKKKLKEKRKAVRTLRTQLGALLRDIIRKLTDGNFPDWVIMTFDPIFHLTEKVLGQLEGESTKLYSVHEPHVACIAKGKSGKKYEFGNKVSIAVTHKNTFIVGCSSFTGNPHDGKTLMETLECVERITGKDARRVFVDNGYQGHNYDGPAKVYLHKECNKQGTPSKAYFKRRAAIEPVIGHMKNDHRMARNFLGGIKGDTFNALLSAVGYNLSNIVNHLAKKVVDDVEYVYPYYLS